MIELYRSKMNTLSTCRCTNLELRNGVTLTRELVTTKISTQRNLVQILRELFPEQKVDVQNSNAESGNIAITGLNLHLHFQVHPIRFLNLIAI